MQRSEPTGAFVASLRETEMFATGRLLLAIRRRTRSRYHPVATPRPDWGTLPIEALPVVPVVHTPERVAVYINRNAPDPEKTLGYYRRAKQREPCRQKAVLQAW